MTAPSLDHVIQLVSEFVAERRASQPKLGPDTRLMTEGYLDSFALAELTGVLEERLGLKLSDGSLIPEDFETPRTLQERLDAIASG